jgi:hypothetical protein
MAINPELKQFIDRVVVPALLERFLREHAAGAEPPRPDFANGEARL